MDHETLFTASKWDILKHLEKSPRSPLELAGLCKTSIANVSQQLRLLEMAGLVTSERVPNRDKGKPRVLYRLAGHYSYLIATSGDFVDKKLVALSDVNKIVMRIWFYDKPALHYTLEKTFWRIEEHLPHIAYLGVDTARESPVTIYVRFTGKPIDLKPFTITDKTGVTRQVIISTHIPAGAQPYAIYGTPGPSSTRSNRNSGNGKKQQHSGDGHGTQ